MTRAPRKRRAELKTKPPHRGTPSDHRLPPDDLPKVPRGVERTPKEKKSPPGQDTIERTPKKKPPKKRPTTL